jgi:hypothetical protein
VLTGLPSVADAGGVAASGPVDLGFSGWTGYLLIGNPGGGTATREQLTDPAARRFGKLLKVNLHGIRAVADFPRFEERRNPDKGAGAEPGFEIDSNPNGLLVRHRSQLVTDAGGNDLLKVDHKGRISVVAVFPPREVAAPPGFPVPTIEMQAVPTSVVKGPDGAFYVGQLTGFPFPVGAANVWRVVPGHKPRSSPPASPTSSTSPSTGTAACTCSRSPPTACCRPARTSSRRAGWSGSTATATAPPLPRRA